MWTSVMLECALSPDLYPIPLSSLLARMDHELGGSGSLYYVARRDWWVPDPGLDTSLVHLGRRIATPSGPASGPHTQLAQNLVMSWITGGRFMELKTVQIDDELVIPRPCIHTPHVGYNVEWSQELRVHQSATEYIKGWILCHMLCGPHGPGLWSGVQATWDLSLGYDLAGIRSEKVRGFVEQMRDADGAIAALLAVLPPSLARWADVQVPGEICDSVTLSTFHGCPASEIEAIANQTLEWGLHTVIKLNPTLLGHDRCRKVLDQMGYGGVRLDPGSFEKDLQWSQLLEMLPRLRSKAEALGLGLGVKFSNTLVHQSDEPPFGEGEMYLSGPPLHVLAFVLAAQLREQVGTWLPITFSAGIDFKNFHEVAACGLGPITSCTDLLKGRGYANQTRYLRKLEERMRGAGVTSLPALQQLEGGASDPAEGAAQLLMARASSVAEQTRYHRVENSKPPKKVGSSLELLDCLTCDKCIPVCPNGANFSLPMPTGEHRPGQIQWTGGEFERSEGEPLVVAKKHQIGNLIDACNLCGCCDAWCPEDGGPYIVKPHLYLSPQAFSDHPGRDGFLMDPDGQGIQWRYQGEQYHYRRLDGGRASLQISTGRVELQGDSPCSTEGHGKLDLRLATTMRLFLDAFEAAGAALWLPPREIR